ncbi:hypothetical protein TWF225_002224 [Orbilia oligospora]|nr:hypothetical protein TWF751_005670 [Orbilia oligospora]KAF3190470.1 hypothetical protein TWF225_002224 [Orbilia oligospora]KAF3234470.1 hypothetical protein TWF217_003598 [Orbilia oligospora]
MASSSQKHRSMIPSSQRGSTSARQEKSFDEEEGPKRLDRLQVEEHVQLLQSLDEKLRGDLAHHLLMTFHTNKHYQQHPKISPAGPGITSTQEDSDIEDVAPILNEDSGKDSLLATMLRYASAQMRLSQSLAEFSADDTVSETLCRPAIERIVASFDRILAGIYRSREGYAADQTIQNLNSLLRRRKKRHRTSCEPLRADDMVIKKQKTDTMGRTTSQVYRQGSQRLLSATDVFQHALVQSFPRGVLERASERLGRLLKLPRNADHASFITLVESKQQLPQPGSLDDVSTVDVDGMGFLTPMFLGTDTERVHMGGKYITRTMWKTWDERKTQVAEEGCFGRNGFLEEIQGQGRTKENRRRMRKEKVLQELEAHVA